LPDSGTTVPLSWWRVQYTVSCGNDLKPRDVMRSRMTSDLSTEHKDMFRSSVVPMSTGLSTGHISTIVVVIN